MQGILGHIKLHRRRYAIVVSFLVMFLLKAINVRWNFRSIGNAETEKEDVLRRSNYLKTQLLVAPENLVSSMPKLIGEQFQGEWAIYSCSMYAQALVNMARLYPETKSDAIKTIDKLIALVKSPELKLYDFMRWGEDPLDNLDSDNSHISYLSHLAWIIGNYKSLGGDGKYDQLYHDICSTMNRRIKSRPNYNLETYPGEVIYIPDMCVAIVALKQYSDIYHGQYLSTVNKWVRLIQAEAAKNDLGLIPSFIFNETDESNGADETDDVLPLKGSYTALTCYYLTMIDADFAYDQYEKMKSAFLQKHFIKGLREYNDRFCLFGMDLDAGPIIMNLSPTGTAFAVGTLTHFHDDKYRRSFMKTAEIAGQTISLGAESHYLLANIALVGESIMLAMRTSW